MSGGRKLLMRLLALTMAIGGAVTYAHIPAVKPPVVLPVVATTSDVPATPVRIVLDKPPVIAWHIALRDVREGSWFTAPQNDRTQLRLAKAERILLAPTLALPQRVPLPLPPEKVRSLIEQFFLPADVELAVRVAWCESRWDANAKNPYSSASGLFQHLGKYWEGRSEKAGWVGASIWDAEANTAVAAWLVYHNGGWSHWNPSKHCWG